MLVHWIWFAHRPGLNDRDKMALLQHFRDPEDIYFADDGAFDAIGLSEEAKTALREKNLTSAEEILEACDREKLHILTCQDAAYPARLKNIADPPTVLYYKGRLPDFDGSPVIGVVGTRKASAYGLTTAKRMGYQIARCGGIVVSGMAYGIDGMAMSGALTAGAPAVGVLGCGADIVYPVSNRALFRDTEEYGCILSEFAPGTPPAKWTLAIVQPQQRNGQAGAQLNQRVNPVNKEEINQRVEKCPEHHPEHLLAEIATVGADEQNRHGCDAAPIGGKCDDADQQDDNGLLPRFQLVAVVDAQQYQSPSQRPRNAGLVEH